MPDDLERAELARAVEARRAAHTPAAVPPFAGIAQRRRARDRRRGAIAVLATVLGVAGAVLLPVLHGDTATEQQLAAPSPSSVVASPAAGGERERFLVVVPDASEGTAGVPDPAAVSACLHAPAVVEQPSIGALTATVTGRAEADAVVRCLRGVRGTTVVLRPLFARHGLDKVWRGATVCDTTTRAPCRRLDTVQASALFRQVSRRTPVRMQVPAQCGPLLDDGHRYLLDDDARRAVARASSTPTGTALTADQARAVKECSAASGARPATGYVGLTEQAATSPGGPPVRVVARDGACLVRRPSFPVGLVLLVVDDGWVVWASRP